MKTDPTKKKRQEGMAMLMVLGVVAATTLLAAHMMAVSETVSKLTAVNVVTSQLRYDCESAVDEAFWMHLTDRKLFTNRNLDVSLDDRANYTDMEPWMLDGRGHVITDTCTVYLNDAVKSFSVENISSVKDNYDDDDMEGLEEANTFIDIYQDYTDSNDLVNIYGKEVEEYQEEGFYTLPRNGAMQYKAELFWLDNWRNVIAGDITIIPPKGLSFSSQNSRGPGTQRPSSSNSRTSSRTSSKPNFFTASEADIENTLRQKAADISDSDIEEIINARREWQASGTPLDEILDGTLLITVKNLFNFTESNYAEITAVATAYGGTLSVRRTVTREVDIKSNTIFANRNKDAFSIWEMRNH